MTSIYACLAIAGFAAASVQRLAVMPSSRVRDPESALLVTTGKAPYRIVFCANAAARAGGVREGMTLPEASARFADKLPGKQMQVLERDEAAEQQAWRELLEAALRISPLVEDCAPGLLLADLAGLQDPHRAAHQLYRAAQALRLPGSVGVSMNRFVATSAARTQTGVTHVFPGQEAAFLHLLPLHLLPLSKDAMQTLHRWGIRSLGAFAALPEAQVVERLGKHGLEWLRMARGQHDTVFQAFEEEEEFVAQTDFDWQVADLDALSFTLSDLLGRLCQRLEPKGLAVGKLRVALKLASGNWLERELLLPTAHTDTATFVTLARLSLSSHPPGEPVEGLRVQIEPAPRRTAQTSLFEPVQPSPEKLDVTLARLHNLVGGDIPAVVATGSVPQTDAALRVGSPMVADSYREDAVSIIRYAPPSVAALSRSTPRRFPARTTTGTQCAVNQSARMFTAAKSAVQPPSARPPALLRMALRCLRPAPEAEVEMARARPVHVSARGVCHGRVKRAAGPWRLGSEWWTDSAWDFEEWDVAIGSHVYRIRCELPGLVWKVSGIYD